MWNDSRWARRAGEGDERAFAAIFRRYHQDLYRFCLAILRDPEDAQDALQNTMVSALRALPGETRQIELKPWLYRIAHNESIDLVRRRRASEPLDPELTAGGPELAREAEARERLGRLLADLETLPERQRSALLMRELSGLEFAEIGAALGCTAAVARQTAYEARLNLRQSELGREMDCVAVTKALSDADGRVARRRALRAHLRECPECRAFRAEIEGRSRDLAALSPLPALAAGGLLSGLFGSGGAAGGAGLAGSVAVKGAVTVAVVAAIGVGAERGNLIEVGPPGGGGSAPAAAEPSSRAPQAALNQVGAGAEGAAPKAAERGAAARVRAAAAVAAGSESSRDAAVGVSPTAKQTAPSAPPPESTRAGEKPARSEAAQHGQETAAAHKQAAHGRSAENPARPEHPAHPQKPAKPEKPAKPAAPEKAPPAQANGDGAPHPPVETGKGKGQGEEIPG
jgi:RNA polymerase sigma factor (sigma-70 family)